jgi:hypothetical protein
MDSHQCPFGTMVTVPLLEMTINFPDEFSESDVRDLMIAKSRLEHPGLAARFADLFGKPIDQGMKALPAGWNQKVVELARKTLLKGLEFAIKTLGSKKSGKSRDRLHKLMVAGSGIAGGAAGIAAIPLELPISTTIMLRSIAEIARSEGHDISLLETKLSCLEVFALGGQNTEDDSVQEGYWVVRTAMARSVSQAAAYIGEKGLTRESAPPIVRFISAIASRFSSVITEEVAAKAVPVIGALAGAAINVAFMQHFQQMARGHFAVKRLERKYGTAAIEKLYGKISLSDLK